MEERALTETSILYRHTDGQTVYPLKTFVFLAYNKALRKTTNTSFPILMKLENISEISS